MKGQALASRVEFVGFTPPDTFEYRIFTDRAERYDRNWSSSGAGVDTDKWCKHIWAAVIYRGDPFTVPLDIPDYDEDGYSDIYDEAWILNEVDLL